MGSKSGGDSLNDWKEYFRTSNSDIFEIIEHSIMVAASDCPKEFRVQRVRIAELLFSCRLTGCLGCDRVELAGSRVGNQDDGDDGVGDDDDDQGENDEFKIKGSEFHDDHGGFVGSKGSKVNSTSRDENVEMNMNISNNNNNNNLDGNFSIGDAEALTDEIEQEREIVGEVLRIKEILQNSQDEVGLIYSDSVLYESLRRLQLMVLTVDILKETEIGKAVNGIKRHSSKQIRHLARSLIDGWKVIVDEWVKATQEIAEGGTPDSVNPSTVDEEEGLPSPPLDEGAFLATQDMDFSKFFDGMDDDGNPRNCELNKNREVRRKPTVVKQDGPPRRREEHPKETTPIAKENKAQQMTRQEPVARPNRPSNLQSGPGRPPKVNEETKVCKDNTIQQKPTKPVIQRRPAPQAERLRSPDEETVQEKIEATKRKLQERYQQAENAKRQRTIQVMELHDLPKQGAVNRNTQGKFGNYNRHWANGRR